MRYERKKTSEHKNNETSIKLQGLTSLFYLLLCAILLAVVRSAGQVERMEHIIIYKYLVFPLYCTSDRWCQGAPLWRHRAPGWRHGAPRWRHGAPRWRHGAPRWCHGAPHLTTWPADLTTANTSAHSNK